MQNNPVLKIIIKYVIMLVIGTAMVLITFSTHDLYSTTELAKRYKIIADAFTVPGALFLLLGLLIALSNQGSLHAIGYMLKRLGLMLIPFSKKEHETYSDYVANKESVSGYSFIVYSGLVFMAVAVVFTILFYTV